MCTLYHLWFKASFPLSVACSPLFVLSRWVVTPPQWRRKVVIPSNFLMFHLILNLKKKKKAFSVSLSMILSPCGFLCCSRCGIHCMFQTLLLKQTLRPLCHSRLGIHLVSVIPSKLLQILRGAKAPAPAHHSKFIFAIILNIPCPTHSLHCASGPLASLIPCKHPGGLYLPGGLLHSSFGAHPLA